MGALRMHIAPTLPHAPCARTMCTDDALLQFRFHIRTKPYLTPLATAPPSCLDLQPSSWPLPLEAPPNSLERTSHTRTMTSSSIGAWACNTLMLWQVGAVASACCVVGISAAAVQSQSRHGHLHNTGLGPSASRPCQMDHTGMTT